MSKKYICFDCDSRLIDLLPAFHGPKDKKQLVKLLEKLKDQRFKGRDRCDHWTPEYWVQLGFERNWGDAFVMTEDFEILKKYTYDIRANGSSRSTEFVILCPQFLRRPLLISASGEAYGSY